MPDTLDLQERARLAINALTSCTNPEADYAVYFNANLKRNPPILFGQEQFNGKFMEALALMRVMSGSHLNEHVDRRWREEFLKWLATDNRGPLFGPDGGRQLAWMAILGWLEQEPCWWELGEQELAHLADAMVHRNGYGYVPDETGTMPTGWGAGWHAWNLQGATHLYRVSGSPAALNHAAELARYLKDYGQVLDTDGHFLARHPPTGGPTLHFHHNANTLVALSEYALATGAEECAAFARQGYEYARSTGSPLVGFFSEYLDWRDHRPNDGCEGCCIADMILLALTLTLAGQGDYWDDVDRAVRNQFAEQQITRSDWIDQTAAQLPPTPVGPGEDGERVSERVVGCFGGWATANDLFGGDRHIQNCCTGNGARALYSVWESMVQFQEDTLRVHLLLNRASPWADVDSCIPYEGRVDVRVKRACKLEVRIPEWVEPGEVSCSVDGVATAPAFLGRYAQVGRVQSGSRATLTFPITERTVEAAAGAAVIGDVPYTLVLKGNEVVLIDPPGQWYPFYQRAHYRETQARWVTRERFVPLV